MPRGDRTGPEGRGSMTGRGMGYCADFDAPGFVNQGYGQGRGMGFGRGRGFALRARFPQKDTPVQPEPISEEQGKQYITDEIKSIREKLSKMEQYLDSMS